MIATRVAPGLCPFCGLMVDGATSVRLPAKPKPGDFTLCIRCAGLLVFDRELRAVKPGLGYYEAACAKQPGLSAVIAEARRAILLVPYRDPKPDQARH